MITSSSLSDVLWAGHGGAVKDGGRANAILTIPCQMMVVTSLNLETSMKLSFLLFGHRFGSPDDVIVARGDIRFLTDGYFGDKSFNDSLESEFARGVC